MRPSVNWCWCPKAMNRPGQHSEGLTQRTCGVGLGDASFEYVFSSSGEKILKPPSLCCSVWKNKSKELWSIWKHAIKGIDWILVYFLKKVSDGVLHLRHCSKKIMLLDTETNIETSCDSFSLPLYSRNLKAWSTPWRSTESFTCSLRSRRNQLIGKVWK